MHICEQCAKENSDSYVMSGNQGFSIHNLLSGLLNIDPSFTTSANKGSSIFQEAREVDQCPKCGLTFQQFRKTGRFGCAECYRTFDQYLNPVLRKVHSGNTVHNGKVPKRIAGSLHVRRKLELMQQELKQLIEQEEFEKAAEVRDQIRALEHEQSQQREGD